MKKDKSKYKTRVIYVCKNCKAELSHGAIICRTCGRTDPKLEVAGVINQPD